MTEPAWLTLARAEIGTLEIKGAKHNPKIVAYFKDAFDAGSVNILYW